MRGAFKELAVDSIDVDAASVGHVHPDAPRASPSGMLATEVLGLVCVRSPNDLGRYLLVSGGERLARLIAARQETVVALVLENTSIAAKSASIQRGQSLSPSDLNLSNLPQPQTQRKPRHGANLPMGRVTAQVGPAEFVSFSGRGLTLEKIVQWLGELLARATRTHADRLDLAAFAKGSRPVPGVIKGDAA